MGLLGGGDYLLWKVKLNLPPSPGEPHGGGGGGGNFKNQNWYSNGVFIQSLSFLTLKLRSQIRLPGIQDSPVKKKIDLLYMLISTNWHGCYISDIVFFQY